MLLPFEATIYYENDKFIYCKINNIQQFIDNVASWKENRMIDKVRIPEIVESYLHDNIVESPIFISQLIINNVTKYRIWDGQHRYYAIKKILKNQYMSDDIKNEIFNNKIFCYIYKNMTYDSTYDLFVNINKSIPVTVFKKHNNNNVKKSIEYIVNKFTTIYPSFQSKSYNPKKPNFNIDRIQQSLYSYITEYNLSNISKYKLWDEIMRVNTELEPTNKCQTSFVKKKVNDAKMYLFLVDNFTEFIKCNNL